MNYLKAWNNFCPLILKNGLDMSYDKILYDARDRDMIHLDEEYEVYAWCEMFEITTADLKHAVEVVGPSALRVKHYLNDKNLNTGPSGARV